MFFLFFFFVFIMVKVSNSLPFQFRFFSLYIIPFIAIVFVFWWRFRLLLLLLMQLFCCCCRCCWLEQETEKTIERIGGDIDINSVVWEGGFLFLFFYFYLNQVTKTTTLRSIVLEKKSFPISKFLITKISFDIFQVQQKCAHI